MRVLETLTRELLSEIFFARPMVTGVKLEVVRLSLCNFKLRQSTLHQAYPNRAILTPRLILLESLKHQPLLLYRTHHARQPHGTRQLAMATSTSAALPLAAAPAMPSTAPLAGQPVLQVVTHFPAVAASQTNQPPPAAPPPASTPQTVLLTADEGLTASFALRLRFAKTDPRYAGSLGVVKYERRTSSGPRLVVWTVAVNSVAHGISACLLESLRSLIDTNKANLEAQRPPRSPGNPSYALQCYFLGPDQNHATPYVCIISPIPWFRKAIRDLVVKSAQLKPHRFKCVGLNGDPLILTAPAIPQEMSIAPLRDFQVRIISQHQEANGVEIEILHDESVIGRATIGGVVRIANHRFGMTVQHAFKLPEAPLRGAQEVLDDDATIAGGFEAGIFDFDSEESDDEDDIHSVFTQQLGGEAQIPREQSVPAQGMLPVLPDHYDDAAYNAKVDATENDLGGLNLNIGSKSERESDAILRQPMHDARIQRENPGPGHGAPSSIQVQQSSQSTALIHRAKAFTQLVREAPDSTALVTPDSRLDWALKKVTAVSGNRHFSKPSKKFSSEKIEIKTPSQLLQGELESSGIFGIHNLLPPQPVLVALVRDGAAQPGESGSWAMKLEDGTFAGMLLGSCPSMKNVYILPMSDILDDIYEHTGCEPTVPTLQKRPTGAYSQQPRREAWAPPRGGGVFYMTDQYNEPGSGTYFVPPSIGSSLRGEVDSGTQAGSLHDTNSREATMESHILNHETGTLEMETLPARRERIQRVLDAFGTQIGEGPR